MNLDPGFIIRVMAAHEYACEAPIPNFTDDNARDLVGLYDSFKLMSRCFSPFCQSSLKMSPFLARLKCPLLRLLNLVIAVEFYESVQAFTHAAGTAAGRGWEKFRAPSSTAKSVKIAA